MASDIRHLSVRNLNVWYGGMQALKDVSVDIPNRGITAIVGPSGCGKSTLLRSMNRLLELNTGTKVRGSVLVDGEDIYGADVDPARVRKKMGLLSQRPQVLPMSIYDNVAYGPRIHGMRDRKTLDAIVEKYLRTASLWEEVRDRLRSPASRLSIGQQQRLCIARGLAVEPEIILGDEPTSALDPQSTKNVESVLLELKKDYTIVIVSHILRQTKRIADHVVLLYMGALVESGPAEDVFHNPRNELTRQYLEGVIS